MSKKLTPNIRFNGFDGDWKESLLNEILIPSKEKNTQEVFSKEDVLSVSGDFGIVNQLAFKGRSFAGVSVAPYGVAHTNDVVYTKSPLKKQPYGIIKTNKGADGIVSTLYAIYSCADGVYPNFVEDYFNSDERLNSYLRPLVRKGAKNDMKISSEGALMGKVCFPEYEEQKVLSIFFDVLTKEIMTLQTKLEKLYALKQTMLIKMFPQGDSLVPEIRVKGFSGEWKKVPLDTIAQRVTRKNTENVSSLPFTISSKFGLIPQGNFFNNRIASNDLSNYYLIKQGEFAYNKSSSDGYPYGAVKRLDNYEYGALSTLYIVFRISSSINSDYLVSYYNSCYWHEDVSKVAAEGARNHGLLNISAKDFMKTCVLIPEDSKEQAAIGNYLQALDKIISLYDQKLSKLKNLKSAFLQNMFV